LITIYTRSNCGKCNDIKKRLIDKEVNFFENNSDIPEIMEKLIGLLTNAGLKNPVLPIIEFEDGSIVSNDMGLYRELRERGIL